MVYIACDHGGLELKSAIIKKLESEGQSVFDLGTNGPESVDYPDFAFAVGERVVHDGGVGIVICKTGVGMSIAANKVKGVRCALCTSVEMGELCRRHNNANVLALGAGNTDIATALDIVDAFMKAAFDGGRHERRVAKINEYDANNK